MCVIINKPIGVIVKEDTLASWIKTSNEKNRDGMGFAVLKNGEVYFEKGITIERALDLALQCNVPDANFVFHARIGTSGRNTAEFTHPFLISEHRDTKLLMGTLQEGEALIFHNGVMERTMGTLDESDTSLLAKMLKEIAPKISENPKYLADMLELIDSTNKFAVISNHGVSLTKSGFLEDSSCFFSNSSYKTYTYPSSYTWDKYSTHNEYNRYGENKLPSSEAIKRQSLSIPVYLKGKLRGYYVSGFNDSYNVPIINKLNMLSGYSEFKLDNAGFMYLELERSLKYLDYDNLLAEMVSMVQEVSEIIGDRVNMQVFLRDIKKALQKIFSEGTDTLFDSFDYGDAL